MARELTTQTPNHSVLCGPRERKEGGNSTQTYSVDSFPSEIPTPRLTTKLLSRETPDARSEQEFPNKESDLEPRSSPPKTFIHPLQILSSLVNRISHISRSIPCISSNHFDSETITIISSRSSITPVPRIDKYPTVHNPGVYRSGPSEFTLKHPDDPAGATLPMTIRSSAIFEIFDHHDTY